MAYRGRRSQQQPPPMHIYGEDEPVKQCYCGAYEVLLYCNTHRVFLCNAITSSEDNEDSHACAHIRAYNKNCRLEAVYDSDPSTPDVRLNCVECPRLYFPQAKDAQCASVQMHGVNVGGVLCQHHAKLFNEGPGRGTLRCLWKFDDGAENHQMLTSMERPGFRIAYAVMRKASKDEEERSIQQMDGLRASVYEDEKHRDRSLTLLHIKEQQQNANQAARQEDENLPNRYTTQQQYAQLRLAVLDEEFQAEREKNWALRESNVTLYFPSRARRTHCLRANFRLLSKQFPELKAGVFVEIEDEEGRLKDMRGRVEDCQSIDLDGGQTARHVKVVFPWTRPVREPQYPKYTVAPANDYTGNERRVSAICQIECLPNNPDLAKDLSPDFRKMILGSAISVDNRLDTVTSEHHYHLFEFPKGSDYARYLGQPNSRQASAIILVLKQLLTLIQGPPGTGKTRLIDLLIALLDHLGIVPARFPKVLLFCTTNITADTHAWQLDRAGVKGVVRFCGKGVEAEMQESTAASWRSSVTILCSNPSLDRKLKIIDNDFMTNGGPLGPVINYLAMDWAKRAPENLDLFKKRDAQMRTVGEVQETTDEITKAYQKVIERSRVVITTVMAAGDPVLKRPVFKHSLIIADESCASSEFDTMVPLLHLQTFNRPRDKAQRSVIVHVVYMLLDSRKEADLVLNLIILLWDSFSMEDIVILTFYSGQKRLIKQMITDAVPDCHATEIQKLRVETVDGFQGEEAKLVILSCVRANENCILGFLGEKCRLNVALSRAKFGLLILGSQLTLRGSLPNPHHSSPHHPWKELLNFYGRHDAIYQESHFENLFRR